MKTLRTLLSAGFLLFLSLLSAQTAIPPTSSSHAADWQQVQKFQRLFRPQSADSVVMQVYRQSVTEHDAANYLHAVIEHLPQLSDSLKINFLHGEITAAHFTPTLPFLRLQLANAYEHHAPNMSLVIRQPEAPVGDDFTQWNHNDFFHAARQLRHSVLSDISNLRTTSSKDYPFLYPSDTDSTGFDYRPTLFDIVCRYLIEECSPAPTLVDSTLFCSADEFTTRIPALTAITDSTQTALSIYRELLLFHKSDSDPRAYRQADLERLRYLADHCSLTNADAIYERRLAAYQPMLDQAWQYLYVANQRAEQWYEWGQLYHPKAGTAHENDFVTALQICDEAFTRWGIKAEDVTPQDQNTPRGFPGRPANSEPYSGPCKSAVNNLAMLRQKILAQSFKLNFNEGVSPDRPFSITLSVRNVSAISYSIYRLASDDFSQIIAHHQDAACQPPHDLAQRTAVQNGTQTISGSENHQAHSLDFTLSGLPAGFYIISATPTASHDNLRTVYLPLQVSRLQAYYVSEENVTLLHVFDRETGRAQNKLAMNVLELRNVNRRDGLRPPFPLGTFQTDALGNVTIRPENLPQRSPRTNWKIGLLSNTTDSLMVSFSLSELPAQPVDVHCDTTSYFYLNKGIYLPGDSLAFNLLQLENRSSQTQKDDRGQLQRALPNVPVTVTLRDASGLILSTLTGTTNDFGSYTGKVQLPPDIVPGVFHLETQYGSASFQVANYKRPHFEVTLQPPVIPVKLGDTVVVTGHAEALAGYSLTDTKVTYNVTSDMVWGNADFSLENRTSNFMPDDIFASGTATLDAKGAFRIEFPTLAPSTDDRLPFSQNYFVHAAVTDTNGETQTGEISFNVNRQMFALSLSLPAQTHPDQLRKGFKVTCLTYCGQPTDLQGTVIIERLRSPEACYTTDNPPSFNTWPVETTVWQGTFDTREPVVPPASQSWPSAVYRITLNTHDTAGSPIQRVQYFTNFDPQSLRLPYPQTSFDDAPVASLQPGEKASLYFGSIQPHSTVFIMIHRPSQPDEYRELTLDGQVVRFDLPIRESDRGGIMMTAFFLGESQIVYHEIRLNIPWNPNRLHLIVQPWHRSVLPGSAQNWTVHVTDAQGKPVSAEFTATLYDAAMDRITPFSWETPYVYKPMISAPDISCCGTIYGGSGDCYDDDFIPRSENFSALEPPWNSLSPGRGNICCTRSDMRMFKAEGSAPASTPVRMQLQDAAFFKSQLRTDKKGNAVLHCTLPESLTRWRFLGLAHDRNANCGVIDTTLSTLKPLMVVPNPPRFLREGDTLSFAAKVVNESESPLQGSIRLFLFDTATKQPLDSLFALTTGTQAFSLSTGQSVSLSWEITVPSDISAVTWRFAAAAGEYSDGEENTLAILPRRILVTENTPLTLRAHQNRKFQFGHMQQVLSTNTVQPLQYTLEMSSNPTWDALTALPSLLHPISSGNDRWFSQYYGSVLSTSLLTTFPSIRTVLDQWLALPQANSLLSNLEKNPDLKSALLQETPWVIDAQDETARKQEFAQTFNTESLSRLRHEALRQLQRAQAGNGSWAWFPSDGDNRWLTQRIATGLSRLVARDIVPAEDQATVDSVLSKALGWLDDTMNNNYDALLRSKSPQEVQTFRPDWFTLQYLAGRASLLTKYPLPDLDSTAFHYFQNQTQKYWTDYSLYGQGTIALAAHYLHDDPIANTIVTSLRERAQNSAEMGMSWTDNAYGYWWFQDPIVIQALMIDVFDQVAQDPAAVNNLRTWLLKQKQGHDWQNSVATEEAVYSLLSHGADWLPTQPISATIGNRALNLQKDSNIAYEPGTGYFRADWRDHDITPDMANVTLGNPNASPIWGGLTFKYFAPIEQVSAVQSPLKIKKFLFVERIAGEHKLLDPITPETVLRPGDRVRVHIEIQSDRDLDYVQLKDMRAAGLEPESSLAGYRHQSGLGYYEAPGNTSTSFFIDHLRQGSYSFEYTLLANNPGTFSSGIATLQCMYAPEFSAHTESNRIRIIAQ